MKNGKSTAARLKSADFPKDNSHFPVTLHVGERTGWWHIPYRGSPSDAKFVSTPANLLTVLDAPGHTPTLTLKWVKSSYSEYVQVDEITCSCGHRAMSNAIGANGQWSKGFASRWATHRQVIERLAAPVKVWEAKSARATYTGWVLSNAHLAQFGRSTHNVPKIYTGVHSSHTGKLSLMHSFTSVENALLSAQKRGRSEETEGKTVTWFKEPVVAGVSSSVADLLTAIQGQGESDDLPTLLAAKKLADEFLAYTEPITMARDHIARRIDSLFTFDD
jgi:hypothetical protein